MDPNSPLPKLLLSKYSDVKAAYPGEGRRRWNLRVANEFWALPAEQKAALASPSNAQIADRQSLEDAEFVTDSDPLDSISRDAPEIGLVVRTDYSDEAAWTAFYARLQEGEKEFTSDAPGERVAQAGPSGGPHEDDAMEEDADDESDEDDETTPIFKVVNPSSPDERAILTGISNLTALRLLNDVDLRKAPSRPPGATRVQPPNRLADHDGWQEIYTGKNVWIYDAKSNTDQCVRVVSQTSSDTYGTASGDSWRARVSHICELQVNMFTEALKIDFGGLDRWDYNERQRNMQDAAL
ncbi:hypothetical protein PLICRDRAFT_50584 [Plicaturopsis crispa FD-325 SS-3]|nr:hypothetical protein PLICRDRAFT_50584 [Plicaturopsis crispa FD-325 SS-3]